MFFLFPYLMVEQCKYYLLNDKFHHDFQSDLQLLLRLENKLVFLLPAPGFEKGDLLKENDFGIKEFLTTGESANFHFPFESQGI